MVIRSPIGFTIVFVGASSLAACLPAVKKQTDIVDADQTMVANCAYVKDVAGTSIWAGAGGSRRGFSKARNEARHEAVDAGATHIVWNAVASNYVTSVSGKAYRCD